MTNTKMRASQSSQASKTNSSSNIISLPRPPRRDLGYVKRDTHSYLTGTVG